ncbi:hypothetical protein GUJ93_ZPchr0006g40812 [Zizania palustris]|uniref:Uncharacterized protein n=1 Tax=Zizania palustris TaxID=103762 RepID=A0A8J5T0R9_ZIZPA|nr:hypothetical protein GUJ93_ZPchr0006g40812 [Zizania palustris]
MPGAAARRCGAAHGYWAAAVVERAEAGLQLQFDDDACAPRVVVVVTEGEEDLIGSAIPSLAVPRPPARAFQARLLARPLIRPPRRPLPPISPFPCLPSSRHQLPSAGRHVQALLRFYLSPLDRYRSIAPVSSCRAVEEKLACAGGGSRKRSKL